MGIFLRRIALHSLYSSMKESVWHRGIKKRLQFSFCGSRTCKKSNKKKSKKDIRDLYKYLDDESYR